MGSVPLQLATFMALSAHLRYVKSGRALHLTAAGFWLAFGLVFFEKGLVLPLLLYAVTAAYFPYRRLVRGLRPPLVRYWGAWVGLTLVAALGVLVLVRGVGAPAAQH